MTILVNSMKMAFLSGVVVVAAMNAQAANLNQKVQTALRHHPVQTSATEPKAAQTAPQSDDQRARQRQAYLKFIEA
ncbi:MAG TPA: hypothetical protein VEF04_18415, partial [Blastocatellia bacterium]|nr:hypothetical protein [Blastocatellia bacterium]